MQTLEQLSNFVSRYMALFVILIAGISLFQPWTFIWTVPWITILLSIVMFGMGMTMDLSERSRSSASCRCSRWSWLSNSPARPGSQRASSSSAPVPAAPHRTS